MNRLDEDGNVLEPLLLSTPDQPDHDDHEADDGPGETVSGGLEQPRRKPA